jgi:TatD DNase family protein
MVLADTHAHVCDAQFEADRAEVLRRAKAQGVGLMVEIADGPEGWDAARDLAGRAPSPDQPTLYWTCGFHPHYADGSMGFDFARMKEAAASPRCVAIGEIGLDYFKSTAPKDEQISLFRKTLEVAADLNKPVVIHCREAQADTLRILRSFYSGVSRRDLCIGVIHCFSGDRSFAEGCLDLGFMLGVDGPVTYPSAQPLREVLEAVPADRIVLETDSPYLPPQGHRGKRNEPAHLALIAARMGMLWAKPADEVARQTTENARKLYHLYDDKTF